MRPFLTSRNIRIILFATLTVIQWLSSQSWIVSTAPHANRTNVPRDTSLSITFDRDIDEASLTFSTVKVYGSVSGRQQGSINYSNANRTLTYLPEKLFTVGEKVTMLLTKGVRSAANQSMNRSFLWSCIIKPVNVSSGLFLPITKFKSKNLGFSLCPVELNNDGKTDMVLSGNGFFSVVKNTGGYQFETDSGYSPYYNTRSITTGDWNDDGFMDMASCSEDNPETVSLFVYKNQKNGKILLDSTIQFNGGTGYITSGDVDGNGTLDFIFAQKSTGKLYIDKNNGGGSFSVRSVQNIPKNVNSIIAEDWNSDGFLDLAVSCTESNSISILLNNGDGTFTEQPKYLLGKEPLFMSAGDVDGDRIPDIVLSFTPSGQYSAVVLKNNGNGIFTESSLVISQGYPLGMFLGDWNGDGMLDLSISAYSSGTIIRFFSNDGNGKFTETNSFDVSAAYPMVISSDFQNTGMNDVVAYSDVTTGEMRIYKSRMQTQSVILYKEEINFRSTVPNSTSTEWLKISNTGLSGTLNLSISLKDTVFSISSTQLSIPPGVTDSVAITFSPKKNLTALDTLVITSNDPLNPKKSLKLTAASGTSISGVITGSATWSKANSPYILTGLTVIDNGATVNIDPGVKIMVQSNALLNVDGTLNINGSKNDTILFTSVQPGRSRYSGINIRSTGKLSIAYTIIEYADVGIKAATGSAITNAHHLLFRFNGAGVDVTTSLNATFVTAYDNGIGLRIWEPAVTSSITNIDIHDNDIGIAFALPTISVATGSIENNRIGIYSHYGIQNYSKLKFVENAWGIFVLWGDPLNIQNCEFTNNYHNGIWIRDALSGLISNNTFNGNVTGIEGAGFATITIQDNSITNSDSIGIKFNSTVSIENNTVLNNGFGLVFNSGHPTVRYNTIIQNISGGIIHDGSSDSSVYTENNIYNNGNYGLKIKTNTLGTINATGNYWGTVSDSIIQLHIYDYYDDGVATKVNYKPFALRGVPPYGDHEPSVKITPVTGVKNSVVPIAFKLTDIEQEILHCRFYYSLNGLSWTVIPETDTNGIAVGQYQKIFNWNSRTVLDGYTGGVYVKIIPSDKYLEGVADSVFISLDNNYAPSSSIKSIFGLKRITGYYKNNITVRYSTSDIESDSVIIQCAFRIDTTEAVWKPANITGAIGKKKSGNDSLVWNMMSESITLPGNYYFRITAKDIKQGIPDSILLAIDPVGLPSISVKQLQQKEYSGDVTISYTIIHDQNDTISLLTEYSLSSNDQWKKATVELPTLLPDSTHYSGSIVWNSAADLNGVDNDRVRFRITPVHILNGFAEILDSIHIDNNKLPSVLSIIAPSEKVSGSYAIPVITSDVEKDSLTFKVEYSVSGGSAWKNASISSRRNNHDTAFLRWETGTDLFNQDVNVVLRVTPVDNDSGSSFTGPIIRVDNLSGPLLLSSGGVMFSNDTITINLDRSIMMSSVAGAVTVASRTTGPIQFTAVAGKTSNQFRIIPVSQYLAADTLVISMSGNVIMGLKDSLGNSFDGNNNGDIDGSPADDKILSFNTGYLGDFNLDSKLTVDDVLLFRTIWVVQDKKREIGPATLLPPKMKVLPDGKIDFEDLMVFVQNWNWRMNNFGPTNLFTRSGKKQRQDSGIDSVSLKIAQVAVRTSAAGNQNLISQKMERFAVTYAADAAPAGIDLAFHYDPTVLKIVNISDERIFDIADGGRTLMLAKNDTISGIYYTTIVNMGPLKNIKDEKILLIDVIPTGTAPAGIEIIGEIFSEDGMSQRTNNRIIVDNKKMVPISYDLSQNYPNPFNPSTVIEYQLPKETRISLKVFNMLGQEVAILAEGDQSAGYYSVQWNASSVSSGVYFYRLQSKEFVRTNKMILMK